MCIQDLWDTICRPMQRLWFLCKQHRWTDIIGDEQDVQAGNPNNNPKTKGSDCTRFKSCITPFAGEFNLPFS